MKNIIHLLQENVAASAVLVLVRVYLGWAWLTAGWGKITGEFDASGYLNGAIANATGEHPSVQGWWASFLETFALPNVELFNILVPYGEFLVGLGLIVGCFTTTAVFFGLLMNFSFLLSGTVSTNPTMVILGFIILIAGYNAGKFGVDFYVNKFIHRKQKESNVDYTPKPVA